MFDLDEFNFDDLEKLTIINPATNKPTDGVLYVVSPHSFESKRIAEQVGRDLAKLEPLKKDATEEQKKEREHEWIVELYSRMIKKWEGFFEAGVELECTPEEIKRILSNKRYYFLITQLEMRRGKSGYHPKSLNDSTNGQDKGVGSKAKSK